MDLHSLCRRPIDPRAVAAYLDDLAPAARRAAVLALGPTEQADLYDAVRGAHLVTVDDFVPPSLPPLTEVIHWGCNTLPAFKHFQKRFCRADAPGSRELWGYNHQTFSPFTGPGYYVAYDTAVGEVVIDYTRLPPRGAPGWPRVIPNSERLSRFIYNGTIDTMRGVSKHVTIGRASRAGELLPNWFVLVRDEIA